MTKRATPTSSPTSSGTIAEGDSLARESQWRAAVSRWIHGYAQAPPGRKTAAEQRVRWLIRESGPSIGQHNREQEQRRNAYRILWLSVLCGAVATALIILGIYTEDGTLPILAVGGWIGIIGSITSTIIYAFRLSATSQHPTNASLTAEEIVRARTFAEELDRDHHRSADDGVE